MSKEIWAISEREKTLISSILIKGKKEQEKNDKFAIIEFDDFFKLFTTEEVTVLKKFLSIEPKKIGYELPFIGADSNSGILVPIANQIYFENNKQMKVPCQYLPEKPYEAYLKLNEAIKKDTGKKLLIQYGHRSPARQVFIFFDILERKKFDFNFNQALKRVCFPDYSEHVCSKKQAIDFMTEDGLKGDGFDITQEYEWLKKYANEFGFYESYPKDNSLGMMYEPWHWHFEE